jgi:hypothetical protein
MVVNAFVCEYTDTKNKGHGQEVCEHFLREPLQRKVRGEFSTSDFYS